MNGKSYLIWSLVVIAICMYAAGLVMAIYYTHFGIPGSMPAFLSEIVKSMSLVFATNLGAVLGISSSNANSELRNLNSWKFMNIWKQTTTATRILACYAFIITLVVIFIFWWINGFTEDQTLIVPLIPEMAKSLIGVLAGALAAFLKE